MTYMEEFHEILEEYRGRVEEVEKKKRPLDGIFGMGRTPASDPCHETLDQKVADMTERALKDGEMTDELVNALMRAAGEFEGPSYAQMTLVAIQRHGMKLIPGMSREGRRELLNWYEKVYPKRKRFPIQKEICRLLGDS